jgi:hypothetical protein
MNKYLVRVFLSESRWSDNVIHANAWFIAQLLGQGQSPIGRAIYLGEAK